MRGRSLTPIRPVWGTLVLLVTALLAGCGSSEIGPGEAEFESGAMAGVNARLGPIAMRDVLIQHPGTPREVYPKGGTARMSFVMVNEGRTADTLLEVTAPVAAETQLYADQTSGDGNFRPTPTLAVPVQAAAPAGSARLPYYVELQNLTKEVRVGQTYAVTFRFQNAGQLQLTVPVALPSRP